MIIIYFMPSKVIGWIFLECIHQKALDLNQKGPTSLVKLEPLFLFSSHSYPHVLKKNMPRISPNLPLGIRRKFIRLSGEDSGGFGCPFLIHHFSSDLCCAGCTFESFADGLPHGWTKIETRNSWWWQQMLWLKTDDLIVIIGYLHGYIFKWCRISSNKMLHYCHWHYLLSEIKVNLQFPLLQPLAVLFVDWWFECSSWFLNRTICYNFRVDSLTFHNNFNKTCLIRYIAT